MNFTPEMIAQAQAQFASMSPEQVEQMQSMVQNMVRGEPAARVGTCGCALG